MGTTISPEVSKKNPYWIERHRYYELKHFCLQYPIWKKTLIFLENIETNDSTIKTDSKLKYYTSMIEERTVAKLYLEDNIKLVEKAAKETDATLWLFVLLGVTDGIPYDILKLKHNIPCCKDVYYNLYRKFFFLLSGFRK